MSTCKLAAPAAGTTESESHVRCYSCRVDNEGLCVCSVRLIAPPLRLLYCVSTQRAQQLLPLQATGAPSRTFMTLSHRRTESENGPNRSQPHPRYRSFGPQTKKNSFDLRTLFSTTRTSLEWGFLSFVVAMISCFSSHFPCFRRMYKYHFVTKCFDIDSIMDDMDNNFLMLFSPVHCLHSLLPPVKSNPYGLRSRDHNFQLPVCNSFSRKSFIIL